MDDGVALGGLKVVESRKLMRFSGLATLKATVREIRAAKSVAADRRSFLRLATDFLLFRALKIGGFGLYNREHTVRFRNGLKVSYRVNRGDLQSIREVWFDEVYRLPYDAKIERVVDLGANIGLSSLYLSKTYGVSRIVAVEPNKANASLVRQNLEQNGVSAWVIEAAVGPSDGVAFFSDAVDSNVGALSKEGREVRMVSMQTVCSEGGIDSIDLLKMDIEGGEQALLTAPHEWLGAVQRIIVEFHPNVVDDAELKAILRRDGYRYIPCGSVRKNTCDTFLRQ